MPPRRPARARPGVEAPAPPRLAPALDEVTLDLSEPADLHDVSIIAVTGEGDLDDLELVGCVLDGVHLTALSARRVRLTDVVLRNCELSGLDLTEARLRRVRIEGCRAGMLEAGMVTVEDLDVIDSKLTEAGFRMATLERAHVEGCDLAGLELIDGRLESVEFVSCDLTGADVSRARMADVRFRRSTLDGMLGVEALAGATIDPAQLVPVALALFASLGIALDDPEAPPG
ncbi:MAG TPA: pentapeptide repeat-containing protein [Acidimicrobiales bacterium]